MKNKEAYIKSYVDCCLYYYGKAELTGQCLTKTGGPDGHEEFMQIQVRLFGIPLYKKWVEKDKIYFFDKVEYTQYKCDCIPE